MLGEDSFTKETILSIELSSRQSYFQINVARGGFAQVSQPLKGKTKANRTLYARFSPRMKQVTGQSIRFPRIELLRILICFIVLFAFVVIGRSNYFGIGFSTAI